MNDDFFKKIAGLTNVYDNFDKISGLSNLSVAAMVGVPNFDNYSNFESIVNISNSFNNNYIHNVLANNNYFVPLKVNPINEAFTNVKQLFNASTQFKNLTNIEHIYKALSPDLSKPFIDISNFNWREKFPEFNYDNTKLYNDSIEVAKFANTVSINENVSNIKDGLIATLNLDSENLDDLSQESIEIFNIANETIESIANSEIFDIEIYYEFLQKISKYVTNKNVVEFIKGVVMNIFAGLFLILIANNVDVFKSQQPQNTIEEIISSKVIPVKVKPILKSKDCYHIPEGNEFEVIKRFKVFARINYNDSNGDKQVGYCKIVDLKE